MLLNVSHIQLDVVQKHCTGRSPGRSITDLLPYLVESPISVTQADEDHMMRSPFKKILAANRGEIAVRIFRAVDELDVTSVSSHPSFVGWSGHLCVGTFGMTTSCFGHHMR